MPRLILICSLSVLCFFTSCKKSADSNSIIGNWELRVGYGGQGGQTTYPPGNGTILKYWATSYEIYSGRQLIKKGQYKIIRETSYITGQLSDRLIYDNEYNSVKTFIQVSNNRLLLRIDGYDAPSAEYARISSNNIFQ